MQIIISRMTQQFFTQDFHRRLEAEAPQKLAPTMSSCRCRTTSRKATLPSKLFSTSKKDLSNSRPISQAPQAVAPLPTTSGSACTPWCRAMFRNRSQHPARRPRISTCPAALQKWGPTSTSPSRSRSCTPKVINDLAHFWNICSFLAFFFFYWDWAHKIWNYCGQGILVYRAFLF